ncbi:hypothetical protein [Rahnella bonaserana]|jgi:hypothetical protein|uniref:hypothetical protein n=1 Tax=Rahnella bonaserana TaxID=2816248 RepID=UPI00320A99B7
MKKILLFLSLPLFLVVNIASATVDCGNLKLKINAGNNPFYQDLVQKVLVEKVSSKQIDVSEVLSNEGWLAIFASTKTSEPGVFFFQNKKFIDVWGGMVEQDEKTNVLKWAHGIHAPEQLAHCFFDEIVIK